MIVLIVIYLAERCRKDEYDFDKGLNKSFKIPDGMEGNQDQRTNALNETDCATKIRFFLHFVISFFSTLLSHYSLTTPCLDVLLCFGKGENTIFTSCYGL
jgi:hypothetical protein